MLCQFAYDIRLARWAGQKGSGKRARNTAIERYGLAAIREGRIPAFWYLLRYKPNPERLFGAAWPDYVMYEAERPHLIERRYSRSPWFPAWQRGITWQAYCLQRETLDPNGAALDPNQRKGRINPKNIR